MTQQNIKLIIDVPYKKFLNSWELRARAGVVYPQQQYLLDLQKLYQENLSIIIHNRWLHLSSLLNEVDSSITQYVFLAINRYLLLPETVSLIDDYDLAIIEYCKLSKKYKVKESRFNNNLPGNTGNAVFPDIGILYEKKPS